MKIFILFLLTVLTTMIGACRKFVTIDPPPDQIVNPAPFSGDASATATITGIYSEMMNGVNQFSSGYTTLLEGMYADELYYYSPSQLDEFVASNISQTNHGVIESGFWLPAYKYIYAANLALEQLQAAQQLSAPVKQRLIGEALFIRAFCYASLVNIFGDVPLVLHSGYQANMKMSRTSSNEVYKQIFQDLADAIKLLPSDYPETDRTRPNRWAATAFQARLYLYVKDYSHALTSSAEVINSGLYSLEADLNAIFLKGSNEAIWQLQPVLPSYNTTEGNKILPAINTTPPTFLVTEPLLNGFENGDQRKLAWIKQRTYAGKTLYYPYKYKVRTSQTVSENYVVLRLAELYLIRAEANAQLGNTDDAINDLNIIRTRAGLSVTPASSANDILLAIEQERRAEFCFEWGHRWFDIRRTGRASAILSPIKPGWTAHDTLWPIPIYQLRLNSSLSQNEGY
jgi:hypothetical protein